jgi:hypothetical protein
MTDYAFLLVTENFIRIRESLECLELIVTRDGTVFNTREEVKGRVANPFEGKFDVFNGVYLDKVALEY